MLEHQIIKLVLQKDQYRALKPYIYENMLPEDIRSIYRTIVEAHDKYDHDLKLNDVEALHFSSHTLSEAKKRVVKLVLEKVGEAELLSNDVLIDVAKRLSMQKVAEEGVELLSSVVLGKEDDLNPVLNLLQNYRFESRLTAADKISTDLSEILPLSQPENRYRFNLAPLQERVQGAGPGNFIVVFGRPEIGKSTFIASNNIGYMKQGHTVVYFGNEEPGHKIMLNHVRAATGLTEEQLQENFKKGRVDYENWDKIKDKFILYDTVGLGVSDVNNYVAAADANIVVVDQLDKLQVKDSSNKEHTRLKQVYVQAREIAKRNGVLVIGVSQASVDAENKRYLQYSMLDESKTGKAGEADVIIGIGKQDIDAPSERYIQLSKNKITGNLSGFKCMFDTKTCRVTS